MVVLTSLRQAQGRPCGRGALGRCGHLPRPRVLGVIASLKQVGGEAMAEGVAGDGLVDGGQEGGLTHGFLQTAFVQVVSAREPRAGVCGEALGGEYVLPPPLAVAVGILALQRVGQVDGAVALGHVFGVHVFDAGQMFLQAGDDVLGQHGDAVLLALALAEDDEPAFEIQVLHAQARAFKGAQAAAIEDLGHDLVRAGYGADDAEHFRLREHCGQAFGLAGADGIHGAYLLVEHFAVEVEQRGESSILRRGSDLAFDGEVGEEGRDFGVAHFLGVAFVVEKDKALDPFDVDVLGADRVVLGLECLAHLVEELLGGWLGGHRMGWPDALPGSRNGIYWYGRSEGRVFVSASADLGWGHYTARTLDKQRVGGLTWRAYLPKVHIQEKAPVKPSLGGHKPTSKMASQQPLAPPLCACLCPSEVLVSPPIGGYPPSLWPPGRSLSAPKTAYGIPRIHHLLSPRQ